MANKATQESMKESMFAMGNVYARLDALRAEQPTPFLTRILTETEFALRINDDGRYDAPIEETLSILEQAVARDGCIVKDAALRAESCLLPLAEEAKKYTVMCVGHAHIDMNWMWRYDETVSITLDTFRTVLKLMDEYPDFTYAQSQASVYEIVERYDHAMLERIRRRVHEGRWEVSAATWVEADRNLPSGESVARHLLYTRKYLSRLLGIEGESLNFDYEPDTFGHNASTPEMLAQGGIRYYYHCRGDQGDVLYRWASPSGASVLCYREPFWYLGPVQYDFGFYAPDFFKAYGLRTILRVYGVGDHGGGPTRRDIERIHEMQAWPIYPKIVFSTYQAFFAEAEKAQNLKTVEGELNYVFTGCYTSQSRIKMANRYGEAHLDEGERFAAIAALEAGREYPAQAFEGAWRNILFNQFHDIIPGSGVIDTREHAMGIFSEALAAADTQKAAALRALAETADTSAYITTEGMDDTNRAGAGVGFGAGYGVKAAQPFRIAQIERGRGMNRVFHIFNAMPQARKECVEVTVWDWPGDLARMRFIGPDGKEARHQLITSERQRYWAHEFVRVLVEAELPACGRAAYVLTQADGRLAPLPFSPGPRIEEPYAFPLENDYLRAELCPRTGALLRLYDKKQGLEVISAPAAFFRYIEEEPALFTAGTSWTVGRYRSTTDLTYDVCMRWEARGPLMNAVLVTVKHRASVINYTVRLKEHASLLEFDVDADWREVGVPHETTPQLSFQVPFTGRVGDYIQDIPGGVTRRAPREQDVPCQSFAAALLAQGGALMLAADSKYGFRCGEDAMSLTCLRSSSDPDPVPEFGKHRFRIGLGMARAEEADLLQASYAFCHPSSPINDLPRKGDAPMAQSYLEVHGAQVQAVKLAEDGKAMVVRMVEISGKQGEAILRLWKRPKDAAWADTHEKETGREGIMLDGKWIRLPMRASGTATLRIMFA